MIGVDTNVLVYAHRSDSPFHSRAAEAVRSLAEGRSSWAIPWPCLHEFLAIVTHPRIYQPPTPVAGAVAQVEAWLDSPSVVVLHEGMDHWRILGDMLISSGTVGPRVHDARIAAICLSNGVRTLWSADRDFGRFPIKVHNPIAAGSGDR